MSGVMPLDDVRVLDLTHYTAGPFCTRILGDYGADVVKIERPGRGDPARSLPPFHEDQPGLERSGLFLFLNTNKRSVTVDLRTEQGQALVLRAARDADEFELMELLMTTAGRERAGEFALTAEMAESIRSQEVEIAAAFIQYVRF